MDSQTIATGELVNVVLVARTDAKRVKEWLQQQELLSDRHRMCSASASTSTDDPSLIAIPIVENTGDLGFSEVNVILGTGMQVCPLKSSQFASRRTCRPTANRDVSKEQQSVGDRRQSKFNNLQAALFHGIVSDRSTSCIASTMTEEQIATSILCELDQVHCPSKLQFFGDDRTLVLSETELNVNSEESNTFTSFLNLIGVVDRGSQVELMDRVFAKLAADCHSPRIIRRCRIDVDSGIRESNFAILWPKAATDSTCNFGPKTLKWITVTENGIRQSFNLTRVMFSRGNFSEKLRFGSTLVQPDETILDMYAGIGYFTLPALVHGKARHVVACEWNPHAVKALQYNLIDNAVNDRATVYQGDCRQVASEHQLIDMFDRISLGLLPSSQGGWSTAVRALKRDRGGWLHVHGNVPVKERTQWYQWLCKSLLDIANEEEGLADWAVVGSHLEKVKSFAPTVNHYVADVWMGPVLLAPANMVALRAGSANLLSDGEILRLDGIVEAPSCALSDDGALSQEWMR